MENKVGEGRVIAEWTQTIRWLDGSRTMDVRCPGCGDTAPKPVRLELNSPWPPHPLQPQVWCPECGTAYNPTMTDHPREAGDPLMDFYLEQNAGIDVMAQVLAAVDPARVSRFLEIGCGFGFLLDFAGTVHGWKSRGFDPGFNSRFGREALGIDIALEYLEKPSDAGPEPYDLILCSELIEHVFEPEALLAVVRQILAPGGTLLLTTPNAAVIRPETQTGTLLSAMCPTDHVAIYSPKGLEALLRRSGFAEVRVVDLGHTLRAAASMAPIHADFRRPLDRRAYADYLRARIRTTDPVTPIGVGFRYRLLKETVNRGDYAAGKAAAAELAEAIRAGWSIDLGDPVGLAGWLAAAPADPSVESYHARYPFCLGTALYFMGIIAWQADADHERAHLLFKAAGEAGERMRTALHSFGVDDEETEELTWRARVYAAHVLAWTRPDSAALMVETLGAASSAILEERIPARFLVPMRAQLFIDLVNLGHYGAAARLAGPVEAGLPAAAAQRAGVFFAFGIIALNHTQDRAAAADWFERAYRESLGLAGTDAAAAHLLWPALFHQAQALADGGRPAEAAAVLRTLAKHPDAKRLPPLPGPLRDRANALTKRLKG